LEYIQILYRLNYCWLGQVFAHRTSSCIIFNILLTTGCENYHGIGIEIGFTKAWFDCRFPARFKVAIYVKPEARITKPVTFDELHNYAQMRFRNNDLSKWHDSIAKHDNTPKNPKQRNAFF